MSLLDRYTRPQSEDKNPIWLVVLCDMMTILMLFFLMMFSYTYQPEDQRAEFVRTFAVKEIIEPPQEITPDEPPTPPAAETAERLRRLLKEEGLQDAAEVLETETAVRVRLRENLLFKTARSQLDPRAGGTLSVLAGVLKTIPNEVVIEGHTDNIPVTRMRFRSNWELSVARSYSVIERLIAEGVAPARLVAAGYGEFHPVAPNDSSGNRARNRRVEIVILRQGAEG
ncbi:MAG: OmpA family protein [Elusimicrobiota bacterium]